MKLEVGRLRLDPGVSESFEFQFRPIEAGDDCLLLGAVRVTGSMVYGCVAFLLDGHLTARAQLPCSRCLSPVEREIDFDFDEEFDEEDYPGEDAVIDLMEIASQMWLTAIPMRVLCRDDCKGLCPVCGKDLNEGDCGCPGDGMDPRLEALRGLFDSEVKKTS